MKHLEILQIKINFFTLAKIQCLGLLCSLTAHGVQFLFCYVLLLSKMFIPFLRPSIDVKL